MKKEFFITEDFMLDTEEARRLYHEIAAPLPIVDYHCHLPSADIAADVRWENIAQIWLGGDHYKWRAMRSNGVPERYCTGDAPDREKFMKFAETMPYLLRNPLYHWSHLELKRYFGIVQGLLGPDTAEAFWTHCNEAMQAPDFSSRGLMKKSRVALVCTTDDPADSLEAHHALSLDPSFEIQVRPTWRPDGVFSLGEPTRFNAWLARLEQAADRTITSLDALREALQNRHAFFALRGCLLSDYGLSAPCADPYTEAELRRAFDQARGGRTPEPALVRAFQSAMLFELCAMDAEGGWTVQLHLGAMRNNNTRAFQRLGVDKGFDSIGDYPLGEALARHLDRLEAQGTLGRTILYNLNPRDNELIATMLGNFQDGSMPGKMQYGSGWWFLDQKDGMERQLEALSQLGLLSRFVGMVTDSRSFLSYTRHEYFRRILCNLLGNDMAAGLIPDEFELAARMVRDICYNNAARYFGFNLPLVD